MLDTFLQYDTQLFVFLNNLGSNTWDNFWLLITNKWTFVPLYILLLFLIYKTYGLKTMLISILVIVLMIAFTDQVTNLFKHGVKRLRPCRNPDIMDNIRFIAARCSKYGFFSGHSSNSMAAAVFAGLLLKPFYKKAIFLLLFWSVFVGYSRIYVGVHYPLDVICGFAFGAISGYLFFVFLKWLRKRFSV